MSTFTLNKNDIITDALGFPLRVKIEYGDFEIAARHITTEDASTGLVSSDAEHRIEMKYGLRLEELVDFASHEVYHLFFSIRHLITADEETQAEVFGQLVRHVCFG